MVKANIFNTRYSLRDILIIIGYILGIILVAVLIWKFVGPILATVAAILIAYILDLRKFIGKK